MNVNKDNWYEVTVECDHCHDLYDCEMQLYSQREIAIVKEVMEKLFTHCQNFGADGQQFFKTVHESTFSPDERQRLNENYENDSHPLIEMDE